MRPGAKMLDNIISYYTDETLKSFFEPLKAARAPSTFGRGQEKTLERNLGKGVSFLWRNGKWKKGKCRRIR